MIQVLTLISILSLLILALGTILMVINNEKPLGFKVFRIGAIVLIFTIMSLNVI